MRSVSLFVLLIMTLPFLAGDVSAKQPMTIKGKDGAEMALIPSGTYNMGSDDEDLVETAPVHRVHVSSFYMDIHTVTNGQYAEFLNAVKPTEGIEGNRVRWLVLRSDIEDERINWWPTEITFEKDHYVAYRGYKDRSVVTVSWEGAYEYCKWAGKRLPTEAEWEWAARGGLDGMSFPWGNAIPTNEVMHTRNWMNNKDAAPLDDAKSGKPNAYGLYNMAGGVWEWCFDWYDADYYGKSKRDNPMGPVEGEFKVLRGGSWFNPPQGLRVSLRNFLHPAAMDETTGFRCVSDTGK